MYDKILKLVAIKIVSAGVICPCPLAIYMYKIVQSLNVFFLWNDSAIFNRFHMGPSVERVVKFFQWFHAFEQDGRHAHIW